MRRKLLHVRTTPTFREGIGLLALACLTVPNVFAQSQWFSGDWHNKNNSVVLRVNAMQGEVVAGTVALRDTDKTQVPMTMQEPKTVGPDLTFTTTSKGRTTFWLFRVKAGENSGTLTGHVGEIELVFHLNRKEGRKTE
jgi:asparagine N-glycosylation enzyme membrane subunit Stt3